MKAIAQNLRELWEKAITSQNGIEVALKSRKEATILRHALYRARTRERANVSESMGGAIFTDWDNYLIQVVELPSGAATLRISRGGSNIISVREI